MGAMDLENCLCQINPDHHVLPFAVLLFAWRLTPQPWHIPMPSGEGGNHSISPKTCAASVNWVASTRTRCEKRLAKDADSPA